MQETTDPTADPGTAPIAGAQSTAYETWDEVRLRGQPPHATDSPYDFTFRSDRGNWRHMESLLATAAAGWTDVTVQRRTVQRWTTATEWETTTLPEAVELPEGTSHAPAPR